MEELRPRFIVVSWVECEDAIWVLDYKSGKPSEDALMADYRMQIAGYREVVQAIFPDRLVTHAAQ